MNKISNFSKSGGYLYAVSLLAAVVFLFGCGKKEEPVLQDESPHVVAANQIEAGRYIAIVGGCNDCHTDRYRLSEGKVPEENWFTGAKLGFQGEWGTTYPPNLRLTVQELTEEEWVLVVHERTDLPPMPWMNVNQMSEKDAKALYHYLRSLGPKGEHSPNALAPGVEPETPFVSLVPKNLPQK